jgi:hypothetical protein
MKVAGKDLHLFSFYLFFWMPDLHGQEQKNLIEQRSAA